MTRPAAGPVAWVLLTCTLVGFTLNNTHPYQGDEDYYITAAAAMATSGDLLTPRYHGEIRLQKPILTYWLTALGYKAFGISLWAGRVPFLLLAAALLLLVHRFGELVLADREAASLAVVLLSSSLLFLLFSRVSMTERARRLAALAAVIQVAGIWLYGSVLGRPLNDLVREWEQRQRRHGGSLALHAMNDRETAWVLAIAGGRLVPCRDGTPYVIAPAE